jgi:DUF971 family protein
MSNAAGPTDPVKIKKLDSRNLMIQWADGHESRYVGPVLRGLCPCASCQDEDTGQRLILPIHIPDTLEFKTVELVGLYALQFGWSDGHGTGIYSFERLRQLCPCEDCTKASPGATGSAADD